MTILLRTATEADVPALARVGSAAFDPATDVIIRAVFPPHLQSGATPEETQIQWLTKRCTRALGNPDASLIVAADGSEIVGTALWIAPHVGGALPYSPPGFPSNMAKEAVIQLRDVFSRSAEAVFGAGGADDAWGKARGPFITLYTSSSV
jgi:hypothetical protein